MRDIISYIGIDQSRIVKSVKELSKKRVTWINVETLMIVEM